MQVWLWDAGDHAQGVSDSEARALKAAGACLRDGESARVERALVVLAFRSLTSGYIRTGTGWEARGTAGPVTWNPIPTGYQPCQPGRWPETG